MTEPSTETLEGWAAEAQADLWLARAAARLGISYHEYCKRSGILGPSQRRRIRRHESNNMGPMIGDGAYDDSLEH